jgi:flagellar biosynthesis anti-sigma factor FlgM
VLVDRRSPRARVPAIAPQDHAPDLRVDEPDLQRDLPAVGVRTHAAWATDRLHEARRLVEAALRLTGEAATLQAASREFSATQPVDQSKVQSIREAIAAGTYKVDAKDGSIMEAYHFILLADAKKIALDDAGVDVKVVFTTEKLVAGGIKSPYYYFVFESDSARWTYKIDAVLGGIMDKTCDKIIPPAPEFIGLEKAKQIALEDAGLDEATQKIVFTREELSRNSGKPCYILEFYTDKCAYSYKVDAVSGDIIGKKTDWFSRQEAETVPETSQNSDSKQRTDD